MDRHSSTQFVRRLSMAGRQLARRPALYLPALAAEVLLIVFRAVPAHDPGAAYTVRVLVRTLLLLASILRLIQLVIWVRWFRTARVIDRQRAAGALLVALSTILVAKGVGQSVNQRIVEESIVLSEPELIRMGEGSTRSFNFIVSPDGRWLVYGRDCDRAGPGCTGTQIRVRDLSTGEDRFVDVEALRDRSTPDWPDRSEFMVTRNFDRARWRSTSVVLWTCEISLATAQALPLASEYAVPPLGVNEALEYARAEALRRGSGKRIGHDAAIAWDGTHVGEDIYVVNAERWGAGRRAGVLIRVGADSSQTRVLVRRESFADWSFSEPLVSPDGRLVALTGDRAGDLEQFFPLPSWSTRYEGFVFIYDTEAGQEYTVGKGCDPFGLQWSMDGRSLYYADMDWWKPKIIRVNIDIPVSTKRPARVLEFPAKPNAIDGQLRDLGQRAAR